MIFLSPPRLHDFRYTFAVHRLTAWHKHGADLNRMIPALSVYMGYVKTRWRSPLPPSHARTLPHATQYVEFTAREAAVEGRSRSHAISVEAMRAMRVIRIKRLRLEAMSIDNRKGHPQTDLRHADTDGHKLTSDPMLSGQDLMRKSTP